MFSLFSALSSPLFPFKYFFKNQHNTIKNKPSDYFNLDETEILGVEKKDK